MVSPNSHVSSNVLSSLPALLQWDKDVSYLMYRWYATHIVTRLPLLLLEVSGHGVPWLIAPILIFLFKTSLSPVGASLMLNFLALTLLDLAVIGIFKPAFRRTRPAYNTGIGHVTIHVVDQYSFPSGHATRAGFLSSFLWHTQYHHGKGLHPIIANSAFTGFAVLWGASICVSRVFLGRHHVLDVLFGFIVGISYVYLWDPVWISADFAEALRNAFRSAMFGSAHIAKAATGLQSQM